MFLLILETAINVGFSCQLINDDMELLIVDGHTKEQVEKQLLKCKDIIAGRLAPGENDKRYSDSYSQMHPMNVLSMG